MSVVKSTSTLAISSVGMMLFQAATIYLCARIFSETQLADYFLVMAASLVLSPFLSLGINDGVLYYVGREREEPVKSLQILLTALACLLGLGLVVLAVIALASGFLSSLFFSDASRGGLVFIAALLAVSRFTYDTVFRYFTASRRVLLPGFFQLLVMGLLPFVVILIGRPLDVKWLMLETAAGTVLIWMGFLGHELLKRRWPLRRLAPSAQVVRALVVFGVQRVPTILGLILLLSSPVLLAERLHFTDADVVIIGGAMALLRMMGITNQLMTYVIMPRVAWARENAPQLLGQVMWILVAIALLTGFCVTAGLVATGDAVLGLWLKRSTEGMATISLPFWLAAFPFIATYFLRPTIDALHVRAYNTVNVLVAVAVMLLSIGVLRFGFRSESAIGYGVLLAAIVLCALSIRTVLRLTPDRHIPPFHLVSLRVGAVLLASGGLAGGAWVIRTWETTAQGISPYIGILLMGLFAGAHLLVVALCFRTAWTEVSSAHRDRNRTPVLEVVQS